MVEDSGEAFVLTPEVEDLIERALGYLDAGYAVHLAGPPGTGKTTLAFHLAGRIGRPVTLVHGDDAFSSADLVGKEAGYRKTVTVDNYIASVVKREEAVERAWSNQRLTQACLSGHTLIYDEFNRSRPEANTPLLSVLSERILNVPRPDAQGHGYVDVHPEFRAIFTSNPEEYAGVHKTQEAMLDRMVTIQLGHLDRDSEIAVVESKSSLAREHCATIVDIVRELRTVGVNSHRPTIRAAIAIARVLASRGAFPALGDRVFRWACQDLLANESCKVTRAGASLMPQKVDEVVARHLAPRS